MPMEIRLAVICPWRVKPNKFSPFSPEQLSKYTPDTLAHRGKITDLEENARTLTGKGLRGREQNLVKK